MGLLAKIAEVYRDSEIMGVPASGAHDPRKPEIRALLAELVGEIAAGGGGLPADIAADLATVAAQLEAVPGLAGLVDAIHSMEAEVAPGSGVIVYEDGAFAAAPRSEFKGDPGGNVMALNYADGIDGMNLDTPDLAGVDLFQTAGYRSLGKGQGHALYRRMLIADALEPGELESADGVRLGLVEDAKTPFMFGAKGDGVADDTTALKAWAASGGNLYLPLAARFKMTDTLTFGQPGQRIDGPGEIVVSGAGMASKPAIKLTADGIRVCGVRLANPEERQSATGNRSIGIEIAAHRCRVVLNDLSEFQNGVTVRPDGEYFDNKILFNDILDCIGVGQTPDGPNPSYGEDRGDGICSWGGRTHIIGNTVSAKVGHDCRVGIHVEALGAYVPEGAETAEDDTQAVVIGNIVRGPFRRHIVNEGVDNVVITDNIMPGGATWWNIAILQGVKSCKVARNIIVYDREPDNEAGAAWSPAYAAVNIYNYTVDAGLVMEGVVLDDNDILVTAGGGRGLRIGGHAGNTQEVSGCGNRITAAVATAFNAVGVDGDTQCVLENRKVSGPWLKALSSFCPEIVFEGGVVEGTTAGFAFEIQAASRRAVLDRVTVRDCPNFAAISNGSAHARVRHCDLDTTGGGAQIYLTAVADGDVHDNTFRTDAGIEASGGSDITYRANRFLGASTLVANNVTGLVIADQSCAAGNGTITTVGSTNRLVDRNHGYSSNTTLAADLFTDASSWLNTWGKHAGKTAISSSLQLYICQGSDPTSGWRNVETGAVVTPA